jgi:hypothetical protein
MVDKDAHLWVLQFASSLAIWTLGSLASFLKVASSSSRVMALTVVSSKVHRECCLAFPASGRGDTEINSS